MAKVSKSKPKKSKKISKRPKSKKPSKKISKTSAKKIKKNKITSEITQNMALIGSIVHYFPHVKVGVINISEGTLAKNDNIFIKGHTTKFRQKVSSLEIDHKKVNEIKKNDDAGILLKARVRIGDLVYKIG